jgi:hypothetical protein
MLSLYKQNLHTFAEYETPVSCILSFFHIKLTEELKIVEFDTFSENMLFI